VIKFAAHRAQTGLNIAKAFAVSELSKAHRKKLIPAGEALLLVVAAVPAYTLLEFISRKVLHELRENSLAKVHPSLSALASRGPKSLLEGSGGQKQLKSKNLKTISNCHALRTLAGIQNSSPGQ
jgi:hypothetical protein